MYDHRDLGYVCVIAGIYYVRGGGAVAVKQLLENKIKSEECSWFCLN